MKDRLILPNVLDAVTLQRILGELGAAAAEPATVYGRGEGGLVESRVRRARILQAASPVMQIVNDLLDSVQGTLSDHFEVDLRGFEPPQFLHYEVGDFFVAHQDGNTGMLRDESRFRRISVVLFLNEGYGGGSLLLHGSYPRVADRETIPAASGSMVAFPSETTHEVTPVTAGDRFTVVSWFRG